MVEFLKKKNLKETFKKLWKVCVFFFILLLPKRQYLSPIVRAPPRAFLYASTLAHPWCCWVWMWGICFFPWIGILTMVHDIPHVTGKNSGPEFSIGRYPCVGEVSCSYQRSTYSSRGNCCLVAVWTGFFHCNCLEWKSQIRTTLISWF